jgi:alkylhydroperoxidase family enzyme
MAITWEVKITNVNLDSNRATVTATRTDDGSSEDPQVYSFNNVPLETGPERAAILASIKAKCEERAAKATAISTWVDTLETTGMTELEAWELTR